MEVGRSDLVHVPDKSRLETETQSGDKGGLSINQVTKSYGRGQRRVDALAETSLEIEPGDFVSIVGPSGCGKTTLLKILGDVIPPTDGVVLIDGEPARNARRFRQIGVVFQSPVLLPWRTVRENVILPFQISRSGGRFRKVPRHLQDSVDRVLDTVGLVDFADRFPTELSGGMQSRVSLARSLVYEPSVLLMDEPFSALDELTRTEMALHLLDVWERFRVTVVFVTHHIEEAVLLSNRVLVMSPRPGKIRRDLTVDLPRPRSLETRKLPFFKETVEDLIMDFHMRAQEHPRP